MSNTKNSTTTNLPAFDVLTPRDRGEGQKAHWTRIGAAWHSKDGEGISIELDAYPIGTRIYLAKPKAKDAAQGDDDSK